MILDIIVLLLLLVSGGIAFMRGFIREALTIAGVGGGLVAAYFGGPILTPHVASWLGVEEGVEPEQLFGILSYDILALALAHGGIFLVVVMVLSFLSHIMAEAAKSVGLGAVDRSLGFLFGLVRGIIILGLLYLPFHLFLETEAKDVWFKDSRTRLYLEKTADAIAAYLPEDTSEAIQNATEKATAQGEAINSVRETLQESDLLQQSPDPALENPQDIAPQSGDPQGYRPDFRDDMDRLFEKRTLNE